MGKLLRSRGLLYFMVSMLFVVILVRVLSIGNSGVKELNSQQFLAAVHTHEFVTNPSNSDNQVTVHNGDEAVTGELKDGQKVVYYYPQNYNVAAVLNKAGIPFITIPQNNGFWFTLIGTLAPHPAHHPALYPLYELDAGRRQQGHELRQEPGEKDDQGPAQGHLL